MSLFQTAHTVSKLGLRFFQLCPGVGSSKLSSAGSLSIVLNSLYVIRESPGGSTEPDPGWTLTTRSHWQCLPEAQAFRCSGGLASHLPQSEIFVFDQGLVPRYQKRWQRCATQRKGKAKARAEAIRLSRCRMNSCYLGQWPPSAYQLNIQPFSGRHGSVASGCYSGGSCGKNL